ncbi:MAG: hypothetical protein WC227_02620 [Patescibacteria group bacterium]|jgi:uncharacterized repeat protein (TIGR01451 family)
MFTFRDGGKRLIKIAKRVALTGAALFALTLAFQAPKFEAKPVKSADAPKFNYLAGDLDMLRGAKPADTAWSDPVSANIGDRVSVLFYYHNGVVNTTAHHTTLRVDLPAGSATSQKLTSYLWAEGLQAVSNTVVDGKIVGGDGMTINLPTAGRLEYVPGSTKWFQNGAQTGVSVPDSINSVSGLDIGDVSGCWQYSGYVSFQVDVKGQANLTMSKAVAHIGDATWQEEISASRGDEVIYRLNVINNGNDLAKNVLIKDILPAKMNYVTGTTYLYTKDAPAGVKQTDSIFTANGLALPDLQAGAANMVTITYHTKIFATLDDTCGYYLNNVAKVYMGGVEQAMDQAKVTLRCESRILSIVKNVKAANGWVKQNTGNIGDIVEYQVIVKNTGNANMTNVIVSDIMPLYVNYQAGSTKIDGVTANDQIMAGGLNLGTMTPGQQKVITFNGKIYGCPPVGGYTLYNTAYGKADTVTQIWDSASTVVNLSIPGAPVVK